MQHASEVLSIGGTRVEITVDVPDGAERRDVEDALAAAYIDVFKQVDRTYWAAYSK